MHQPDVVDAVAHHRQAVEADVDVEAGPDVARTASSTPHADVHAITATAAKVRAVRDRDMALNGTGSSCRGSPEPGQARTFTAGARRAQGHAVPLRLLPTSCGVRL